MQGMRLRTAFLLLVASIAAGAMAQIPLPGGHNIPLPGDPFKKGDPITTSIKDAKFEDVSRDGFNPQCKDLFGLRRGEHGGYILEPGAFGAQVQSYCLHAGTHGPSSGDGYLYAPVKGEYHKIVTHVVEHSVDHPEIPQHDVQILLWAIVAREKVSDMNPHLRHVAEDLLNKDEIYTLNGGALGILEDSRFSQVFGQDPPGIREIHEAEARLRSCFGSPGSSYEDFERIAVLQGDVARGPGSRDVPAGRWSKHPEGYWVRYIPTNYTSTRFEIFVPDNCPWIGKELDPAEMIAAPCDTSRQRLIQSGRRKEN